MSFIETVVGVEFRLYCYYVVCIIEYEDTFEVITRRHLSISPCKEKLAKRWYRKKPNSFVNVYQDRMSLVQAIRWRFNSEPETEVDIEVDKKPAASYSTQGYHADSHLDSCPSLNDVVKVTGSPHGDQHDDGYHNDIYEMD